MGLREVPQIVGALEILIRILFEITTLVRRKYDTAETSRPDLSSG